MASFFPVLHGIGKDGKTSDEKGILETRGFQPVALSKYLSVKFSGNPPHEDKTRFASYMYHLETPGSFCILVWDFTSLKSAQLLDDYFSKPRSDICGDYIYGKLYAALSKEDQEPFQWIFEV